MVQKDSRPAAKFEFSGFRRRRREKLELSSFILLREQISTQTHNK